MSVLAGTRPVEATLRLRALPGVFHPHSDARLLASVMAKLGLARDADVLDVFTGSGVLAVSAARCGARSVTAVDVSRRAVLTARGNARRNGVRVRALRGDLFAPVAGESFDLVLANPPYLPAAEVPARGAARAWEGGPSGRVLVDRLCEEVPPRLRPHGTLLLVHSSITGERETLGRLAAGGLGAEVVSRHVGPLGPLARAALARLSDAASDPPHEEMLVIAARRG